MQGELGVVLERWNVLHGLWTGWPDDPSLLEQHRCKHGDAGPGGCISIGLILWEDNPLQPHTFLAGWLMASWWRCSLGLTCTAL